MTGGDFDPHQVYETAIAHQEAGEFERAESLYRRLLADYPGHAAVNHNLGLIRLSMGLPAEAMSYFRVAMATDSGNPEYHLSICCALVHLGYIGDVLDVASKAIGMFGEDPRFRDFIQDFKDKPCMLKLQGSHAPERQVYMSALIHKLRNRTRPISILEVGSFMGASLLTWSKAVERLTGNAADIVCIDPWEGADRTQYDYKESIERYLADGTAYRIFRNNLRFVPDRVTVTELRGMSHEILPTLDGRTFDLIYLDGCHLHPEVLHDIQACDRLLAEGGFICGDDLELQLHEVDADFAMANARTDAVVPPGRDSLFHPGVTLGVGRFFGPVSVYHGFWAMCRTATGYEPVSMAGEIGMLPYHWPEEYYGTILRNVAKDGLLAEVV